MTLNQASEFPAAPPQVAYWKWLICVLLLLATTLNYMDRNALAQTSERISRHFDIKNEKYADLIVVFNVGFGIGALLFGWLVDKVDLRWLYAGLVLAWSAVGFATGFAESFTFLLACRLLLGIFESGNWPCGIMTVKRVLKPAERSLGNGMFQSGTAIGAILIPLVVYICLQTGDAADTRAWQVPFRFIGVAGVLWVVLWLSTVRSRHIGAVPLSATEAAQAGSYWDLWRDRRFYVLIVMIVAVNTPWRTFAEWLPKFLQKGKGYSENTMQFYTSAYFFSADVGSIVAGLVTLWLIRRGRSVHGSRVFALLFCAGLTTLTTLLVVLPPGPWLFVVLLLIGFGVLGSFSSYFAFSQEISLKHQGKVTGTLGLINSVCMAVLGKLQGWLIDRTGYDYAIGLTGLVPLLGALVLWFFWNKPAPKSVVHVE